MFSFKDFLMAEAFDHKVNFGFYFDAPDGVLTEDRQASISLNDKMSLGMLGKKAYADERDSVIDSWRTKSQKDKNLAYRHAIGVLKQTHGIESHKDLLKHNAKLDIDVGKIPHDHPILGKNFGGREVSAIGVQRAPDSIKTTAGHLTTCPRSTASCRDNCLMKTGQNAIPAAQESKARAEYARHGLSSTGGKLENGSEVRKAYHTAMLYGLESNIKSNLKKGNKATTFRAGYSAEDGAGRDSDVNYFKGLSDEHRKHIIATGYSGLPDPNNERPHEAASIKGPGVKEKIDPNTGKHSVEYHKEEHKHLVSMMSSLVAKKTTEQVAKDKAAGLHHDGTNPDIAKNAYLITTAHRNKNPKVNPEFHAQEARMDSAKTVRFHHYNSDGSYAGHSDHDVNHSGSEHHDLRAVDPIRKKTEKGGDKSGRGYVTVASFAGIPKGQTTKPVKCPITGVHVPSHAYNNDMTMPLPDEHGVIHIHHPDAVKRLEMTNPQAHSEFCKNDEKFRSDTNYQIQHKA